MMLQIIALQNFLNLYGHGLKVDGSPGPQTRCCREVTFTNLRTAYGSMPVVSRGTADRSDDLEEHSGRASTYGGKDDPGDYYEGQAYMPPADPDGGGPKPAFMSPAEYIARPDVQQFLPYLRVGEMQALDKWPRENGRAVGVSWFLKSGSPKDPAEEGSPYCALRLRGPLHTRAKRGEEILVRVINRAIYDSAGKYGFREEICRVVDWGPQDWDKKNDRQWWARIDLSPWVYRRLGLVHKYDATFGRYQDHVSWEVLP